MSALGAKADTSIVMVFDPISGNLRVPQVNQMDNEALEYTELFKIEDTFQLEKLGLVLHPDFSVPDNWGSEPRQLNIEILQPNGTQIEALAEFGVAHFNIRDPSVPLDRRWRVVVTLPQTAQTEVPKGSKILVPIDFKSEFFERSSFR